MPSFYGGIMTAFRQEKEADRNVYFRDNLFPEVQLIRSATSVASHAKPYGTSCVTTAQCGCASLWGQTEQKRANWPLLRLCKRPLLLDNVKKLSRHLRSGYCVCRTPG
jgi:hypothetical protein